MSNKSIEADERQSGYDEVTCKIKALTAERDALVKEAEKSGFFFKNGRISANEIVIGTISKWAYYSKYVGEKGAMYDYGDSAYELELDFEALKSKVIALKARSPKEITLEEYLSVFKSFRDELGEHLEISDEESLIQKNWYIQQKTPEKIPEKILQDCEMYFAMLSYDTLDDKLKFRYKGSSDQEEYVNDSGFDIGAYEKRFLEQYKGESFVDEFDAFGDSVEW